MRLLAVDMADREGSVGVVGEDAGVGAGRSPPGGGAGPIGGGEPAAT
jgi:hypothetical protein